MLLRTQDERFDVAYTVQWLTQMLGAEDRALARFRELWAEVSADNA